MFIEKLLTNLKIVNKILWIIYLNSDTNKILNYLFEFLESDLKTQESW